MVTDLMNTKVWIGFDKYLQKRVLEAIYSLGWRWSGSDCYVAPNHYPDKGIPCLYFYDPSKKLNWDVKKSCFDEQDNYKTITVDEIFFLASNKQIVSDYPLY